MRTLTPAERAAARRALEAAVASSPIASRAYMESAEFRAWLCEEVELLVVRAQERAVGDLGQVWERSELARRLAESPDLTPVSDTAGPAPRVSDTAGHTPQLSDTTRCSGSTPPELLHGG